MAIKDIAIGLALMCLWGINFSAIKLGATQIDPILLTALRFIFAVFPAIFFVRRPPESARYLIAYGLVFGLGVWGMMVWSINIGLSAGMAGLLMNMSVISSMALGYLLFKEVITANKIMGAALGFGGLLVCLMLSDGSVPLKALPLTLIAAFCWSLMSLIVKKSGTQHVFSFSVWGMLFAPLPLIVFAYLFNGAQVFVDLPSQMNAQVWFSILFQAYPTTLLGYWVWNKLTVKYPLSTMASFTLLTPIFGLIGSAIFYNESITPMKVLAFALILGGLVISQRPSSASKAISSKLTKENG